MESNKCKFNNKCMTKLKIFLIQLYLNAFLHVLQACSKIHWWGTENDLEFSDYKN